MAFLFVFGNEQIIDSRPRSFVTTGNDVDLFMHLNQNLIRHSSTEGRSIWNLLNRYLLLNARELLLSCNHRDLNQSRQRHDHARDQSSNTAIASFDRGAEPGAGYQSQDRREVAQAADRRRSEDRPERATLHRSQRGGGSYSRRVSSAHAAAVR